MSKKEKYFTVRVSFKSLEKPMMKLTPASTSILVIADNQEGAKKAAVICFENIFKTSTQEGISVSASNPKRITARFLIVAEDFLGGEAK